MAAARTGSWSGGSKLVSLGTQTTTESGECSSTSTNVACISGGPTCQIQRMPASVGNGKARPTGPLIARNGRLRRKYATRVSGPVERRRRQPRPCTRPRCTRPRSVVVGSSPRARRDGRWPARLAGLLDGRQARHRIAIPRHRPRRDHQHGRHRGDPDPGNRRGTAVSRATATPTFHAQESCRGSTR